MCQHTCIYMNYIFQPCDIRRREKVGALYSTVFGSLVFNNRAYPRFLSPVPWNSPGSSVVIVVHVFSQAEDKGNYCAL